jgi:hypothetical protein
MHLKSFAIQVMLLEFGNLDGSAHPKPIRNDDQGILPEHDAWGHSSVLGERSKRLDADLSRSGINQHSEASSAGLHNGQLS